VVSATMAPVRVCRGAPGALIECATGACSMVTCTEMTRMMDLPLTNEEGGLQSPCRSARCELETRLEWRRTLGDV